MENTPSKITLDTINLAYNNNNNNNQIDNSSFFKPMVYTGPSISTVNQSNVISSTSQTLNNTTTQKNEADKISELGAIVNTMINSSLPSAQLNTLLNNSTNTTKKVEPKQKEAPLNILDSIKDPETIKADVEKKQAAMRLELEARNRKLQKQKELIEKINEELKALDTPLTKEIGMLRDKIEACDRELFDANAVYVSLQEQFKHADDAVKKLSERKTKLTEHLQLIMYDFESRKQEKLKELEAELRDLEN